MLQGWRRIGGVPQGRDTPLDHRNIPFLCRLADQFAPRLDLFRQFTVFSGQFTVRCGLVRFLRPFRRPDPPHLFFPSFLPVQELANGLVVGLILSPSFSVEVRCWRHKVTA